MKTTKIVALLLACALLLGGCSLVSIDADKVAEQVVAKVNGTKIYKYEISEYDVINTVMYQVNSMQQFGLSYTQEEIDEMIIEQRESALQDRVTAEVLLQKAVELGIELTEEEKAENMQDAQSTLDSILDYFIYEVENEIAAEEAAAATEETLEAADDTAGTEEEEAADDTADDTADTEEAADDTADDTADTEEAADDTTDEAEDNEADEPEPTEEPTDPEVLAEAQARYQEYVDEMNITLESEYENNCRGDIITKVRDYCLSFAVVTDEEVRTWYDQTLALQQEEMDAGAGVFEEKIAGNNIYTYVPERIVAVRDIVIAFDDTFSQDLKAAYDGEETSQYDALLTAALAEFADYVTIAGEIKTRMESGDLIEDIVEEMSADMDNISEASNEDGTLVDPRTTSYSDAFVKAATGLENIGDITAGFADYKGIHILQLVKVYEPGVIPFEDLADSIKAALLPGKQEEVYNEMVDQWKEEANIVYYYDRLNSNNDL